MIAKDSILTEVIYRNHMLLPVLERFNVKPDVGSETIEAVCKKNKINADFFLIILNVFNDSSYFPAEKLKSFPIQLVVDYLSKNHAYYRNYLLAEIEQSIRRLLGAGDDAVIKLITQFYTQYKTELLAHIHYEEEYFYPAIIQLSANEIPAKLVKDQVEQNMFSVDKHKQEHGRVLVRLNDLKIILIRHIVPFYDANLCNLLLMQLYTFEQDLQAHERLEDLVLLPVITMSSIDPVEAETHYTPTNEKLSEREVEVLTLVASGFANKEIAEKLFISMHTVISHRKNITEKLGIKSIPGLTIYAVINKLIDPQKISLDQLI